MIRNADSVVDFLLLLMRLMCCLFSRSPISENVSCNFTVLFLFGFYCKFKKNNNNCISISANDEIKHELNHGWWEKRTQSSFRKKKIEKTLCFAFFLFQNLFDDEVIQLVQNAFCSSIFKGTTIHRHCHRYLHSTSSFFFHIHLVLSECSKTLPFVMNDK